MYDNQSYSDLNLKKGMRNLFNFKKDEYEYTPYEGEYYISDIKDNNELYYDAKLVYLKDVNIPSEILAKISINDKLFVYCSEKEKMRNSVILKLIFDKKDNEYLYFKELRYNERNELEKVGRYFDEDNQGDDYVYARYYTIKNIKNSANNYILLNSEGEYEDTLNNKVKKKVMIPIRILKKARILCCYYYNDIDDYFSCGHDYTFSKNLDEKNLYIEDIYNKSIAFERVGRDFYKAEDINDLREIQERLGWSPSEEELIDMCKTFDSIHAQVLVSDEKGYITGIYVTGDANPRNDLDE